MKIWNSVRLIGSTRLLGSLFGLGIQGTNQDDKLSLLGNAFKHYELLAKMDNFTRKTKLNFWTKNEDFKQCTIVANFGAKIQICSVTSDSYILSYYQITDGQRIRSAFV